MCDDVDGALACEVCVQVGMDDVTSGKEKVRDGCEGDTVDSGDNEVGDLAGVEHGAHVMRKVCPGSETACLAAQEGVPEGHVVPGSGVQELTITRVSGTEPIVSKT